MKKKIFFSLAVFSLVFSAVSIVKASGNVTGWLWGGGTENENPPVAPWNGENTNLGWISMNSTNCDVDDNGFIDVKYCDLNNNGFVDVSCGGDDTFDVSASCGGDNATTAVIGYGITIPAGDVNVTGYAWSENLGWIDFDPAGPYPVAPNNSVTRNGNNLEGWARIVSIAEASVLGNSGGWEGWISMSGTAMDGSSYGVDITKMDGTGNNPTYAWSDELGWIDFSRASVGSVAETLKVCVNSCNNGGAVAVTTINMNENTTRNLRACYNTALNCSDATGDVTGAAVWTEASSVIGLSYVAPNEVLSADEVAASCVENFSVVYTDTVNVTVNVADGSAASVCGNGAIEGTEECDNGFANGSCPASCSASCTLNNCDDPNWREVAP